MDLPDRTHNKYKPLKSIIVYRWFNIFKILNLLKPVEKFFLEIEKWKNEIFKKLKNDLSFKE